MDSTAILAGASALVAAFGTKLLDRKFARRDRDGTSYSEIRRAEIDDATAIRRDLMQQVTKLGEKVEQLQKEIDDWQARYYEMAVEVGVLKANQERGIQEREELMKIIKGQIDRPLRRPSDPGEKR